MDLLQDSRLPYHLLTDDGCYYDSIYQSYELNLTSSISTITNQTSGRPYKLRLTNETFYLKGDNEDIMGFFPPSGYPNIYALIRINEDSVTLTEEEFDSLIESYGIDSSLVAHTTYGDIHLGRRVGFKSVIECVNANSMTILDFNGNVTIEYSSPHHLSKRIASFNLVPQSEGTPVTITSESFFDPIILTVTGQYELLPVALDARREIENHIEHIQIVNREFIVDDHVLFSLDSGEFAHLVETFDGLISFLDANAK